METSTVPLNTVTSDKTAGARRPTLPGNNKQVTGAAQPNMPLDTKDLETTESQRASQ